MEKKAITKNAFTGTKVPFVGDGVPDIPSAEGGGSVCGKICPSRSNFPDGASGTPPPTVNAKRQRKMAPGGSRGPKCLSRGDYTPK